MFEEHTKLNNVSTEDLLDALKSRQSELTLEDRDIMTKSYRESHGFTQLEGRALVIWADDLKTLVEAASGDRDAMTQHKIVDSLNHFDTQPVDDRVSMLDSAVAYAEQELRSLERADKSGSVFDGHESEEVIYALSIAEVKDMFHHRLSDLNIDDANLSEFDIEQILRNIIGNTLDSVRSSDVMAYALGVRSAVKDYVDCVIDDFVKQNNIK